MKKSFFLNVFAMLALCIPAYIFGQTDFLWSTTYDCNEWEQGQSLNCDGLSTGGDWTCSGNKEQITSDANYSGGAGGKGQRHWEGDGTNVNSGGLTVRFNNQPELWVRWYLRYEAGFKWSSLTYDKLLYFNSGTSYAIIPEWKWADKVCIHSNTGGAYESANGNGWSTIMGSQSDGQWHCYEIHLKMDTGNSDGVLEMWIDEVQRLKVTNARLGNSSGWTKMLIGSNQASPNNGRCMAVDFDDIAISNTGYIGPIAVDPAPSPPTGLTIVQ